MQHFFSVKDAGNLSAAVAEAIDLKKNSSPINY